MTTTNTCTHATATRDCPCWQEGVRATHNRICTVVSADDSHAPACNCPDCETIGTVMLSAVYDAAFDSYLDQYRHHGQKLFAPSMTPADWKAWAEMVATECAAACAGLFAKGYHGLAIVEAGNMARLVVTRIGRNAGTARVPDILRETIEAGKQRLESTGPVAGHCTPLLCHGCPCGDCDRRCHGQHRRAG